MIVVMRIDRGHASWLGSGMDGRMQQMPMWFGRRDQAVEYSDKQLAKTDAAVASAAAGCPEGHPVFIPTSTH